MELPIVSRPMSPMPPPASGRVQVRVGSAVFVADVLRDLGTSFDAIVAQAGLSPALLANPEQPISIGRLGRLFSVCAAATNCPHFGLLIGRRAAAHITAQAAFAAQAAPSIGTLLVGMLSLLPDFSSLLLTLKATSELCTIGCAHIDRRVEGREHIADAVIGLASSILRTVCGPQWRPIRVTLERQRPADTLPYLAGFEASVAFGEAETALSFERQWLRGQPSRTEIAFNQALLPDLSWERALANPFGRRTLPDAVRQVLRSWQSEGSLTAESTATLFGLHPRSFHRRLARSRTSFSHLLDEARYEKACRFLRESDQPVEAVARILGYSAASPFVRAFRRWSGLTPVKWRVREARAINLRAQARAVGVRGKGSDA